VRWRITEAAAEGYGGVMRQVWREDVGVWGWAEGDVRGAGVAGVELKGQVEEVFPHEEYWRVFGVGVC